MSSSNNNFKTLQEYELLSKTLNKNIKSYDWSKENCFLDGTTNPFMRRENVEGYDYGIRDMTFLRVMNILLEIMELIGW